MANRRDLTIGIDGNSRGFERAVEEAEAKARGLDRELVRLERQQAAQERVTASTAAAVRKYGEDMTGASLAARRLGTEAERAAEKAERAQVRSAAAAEAAKRGILDEAKAARIAAQADQELERASLKAAAAQLAQAKAAKKLEEDERKAVDSSAGMRGGLVSLITAAVALAPAAAAAGLALAGMGAVAVPAIKQVISAQKNLTENWTTLDKRQQVAASGVSLLIDQYKTLAKSYEPDALRMFNGLIGTTRGLMPELARTIDETKGSVDGFLNQIENTLGAQVPRLFSTLRGQASPALHELGTTFDQTATLAVSLVHDLAPMGTTLLSGANGVLGLLNALERLDPRLVEVAATLLAVRAPANALAGLWERGASGLSMFGKKAAEAESATAKLGSTVAASPNIYIGAALAVSMLSWRWATAKDGLDHRIEAIQAEADATMNSTAAHQAAIHTIGEESVGWTSFNKLVASSAAESKKHIEDLDVQKLARVSKAIDQERRAVSNITKGEQVLGQQYGLTADQAGQLASAAGVDLAKSMTKSGTLTAAAAAKIQAYRDAVLNASNPTFLIDQALKSAGNSSLALKDRMTALADAFNALAGPELQAFDATTKTAQAFSDLDKAMKTSHGSMDLTTDKGKAARTAFVGLMSAVQQNIDAQYQYDSATRGAEAATQRRTETVRNMLPLLLAEAHGNQQATQAVLDWANSAGVGQNRASAMAGALDTSRAAFMRAAKAAGVSRDEAAKLWAEFQKIPHVKLAVDDAEFLDKLHNAQGLKIDPKTGYLLGNNSDYFNKWLKSKGLKLDAKTGLFRGNNADYYNKWLKANGLRIDTKTGRIVGNTAAFWSAVHSIPQVVGQRSITVTYNYQGSGKLTTPAQNRADGGIDRYADGGMRRDLPPHIQEQPTLLYGETATGGEAYIPLGQNKRAGSVALLGQVAQMFGMAVTPLPSLLLGSSGPSTVTARPIPSTATATLGTSSIGSNSLPDLNLGDILSRWQDTVKPASQADLNKAIKDRKTQVDQLKNAEDALARARKRHDPRAIAAAERRVRKERDDLREATKKLHDVEERRKFAKMTPAQQLGAALGMNIKNNATFIKNLQTLADRGFGALAQQLLAMGGPDAEKIAASAVKLSNAKLNKLQGQLKQSQQQQDYLANLPNILNIRSALKNTKGGISTWTALLNATGLDPASLAAAVKLMAGDLGKTASGKALLADMHAHGYQRGGEIVGPPGVDRVPLWGTAGEYVINKRQATAHRPLLDAINSGAVRVPVASMPVRGGDGARAGASIHQTFATQEMNVHQLAREAAREAAWQLRG